MGIGQNNAKLLLTWKKGYNHYTENVFKRYHLWKYI